MHACSLVLALLKLTSPHLAFSAPIRSLTFNGILLLAGCVLLCEKVEGRHRGADLTEGVVRSRWHALG